MHKPETKIEKRWKFYATNLDEESTPWKQMHRLIEECYGSILCLPLAPSFE
jgi:hypothetical protein